MATPALFELRGVWASRQGRDVLRDLSLDIGPGATAVVGPSGAGKSTLLRLLNRLADPDRGTIRYAGRDVCDFEPRDLRRRASLVAQLPAPLPGTVAENVRYGPALCDREADVPGSLERAGLGIAYAEREAADLSVGEQQRVMLARALALEPDVLLLDEPTAALDQRSRTAIEVTLVRLVQEAGVSLVVVTHDHAQAARLAPKTIVIAAPRA